MALLCAACVSEEGPAGLEYSLGPSGIAVPSVGQIISFGRAETGARAALSKLAGTEQQVVDIPGCGRVVRFRDGLEASFRQDLFIGWRLGDRSSAEACPERA